MRCTKQWLISARVMLRSAADTLDSHLAEICNYFNNRTTSGVTEGINTRIKLIIRQSYGFKNFDLMKENWTLDILRFASSESYLLANDKRINSCK